MAYKIEFSLHLESLWFLKYFLLSLVFLLKNLILWKLQGLNKKLDPPSSQIYPLYSIFTHFYSIWPVTLYSHLTQNNSFLTCSVKISKTACESGQKWRKFVIGVHFLFTPCRGLKGFGVLITESDSKCLPMINIQNQIHNNIKIPFLFQTSIAIKYWWVIK